MDKLKTQPKRFTEKEKMAILQEAKASGGKHVIDKYGLFPATFYYWRKRYNVYGEEGLSRKSHKDHAQAIRKLEKENEILKLLLAEKELESSLKDELLKKRYPEWER